MGRLAFRRAGAALRTRILHEEETCHYSTEYSTLIRANLNDLIDRAENPEKLIKQVLLDMENQLLQLKTQVAVSIADQHMLDKKQKENEAAAADWLRKAERAVDKNQDDLARVAIERNQSSQQLAQSYHEQVQDQAAQVETLKSALLKLEQKLAEAKSKKDTAPGPPPGGPWLRSEPIARSKRLATAPKPLRLTPEGPRHALRGRSMRKPNFFRTISGKNWQNSSAKTISSGCWPN